MSWTICASDGAWSIVVYTPHANDLQVSERRI